MGENVDWMDDVQRAKWIAMWNQMLALHKERMPIAKKLIMKKKGGGLTRAEYKRFLDLNEKIVLLDQNQRALLDEHPVKQLIRKLTKQGPAS